ncbi:MAG: hypothetical protein A2Y23_13260 [Clostridiales bacterium GWB2_37_7]|nr:MAG: hypothetical protein A2Y23_13260 [Clostridiales bacterium GWB2_37_7]
MKKIIQTLIIMLITLLAVGCSVKQNQLVVLQKQNNMLDNVEENLSLNFNIMPQKISIESNSEFLKKLDSETFPLAVSSDTGVIIGFSFIESNEADQNNSRVITGNMVQPINLYAVDTNSNDKNLLGKFLTPKDFQFDETGKLFAFIDGSSNIYIYDTQSRQLQKILEGKNYYAYNSLSWSRDSKKLLINQRMTLDISSKQLISFAVDAYNPFVEQIYNNQEIYIVQMKNNEYNDMIALYNFDSKSFKSLANGVFLDSDNINLIYTKENQNNLFVLNMETLESKSIEAGPIYNAKIMKSTGDILYTTVNPDLASRNRYLLIKFNPSTGLKKTIVLSTPTFYLSPAENKLFFVGDYNENNITINTTGFNIIQTGNKTDDSDLLGIKTTLLKMFQLDYNFEGSYEEYEKLAKNIYANTYDLIPQEALENKLIDFKRFNMPLPTWQKEPIIPPTIVFNTININDSSASVNIGFFFINSIELAKIDGNWMITGFSTHPDSKEVKEIRSLVQKHLNDIKIKNSKEALKYWKNEENSEFDKDQMQIVKDLMKNSSSNKIEIGEIELWSLNEPHRAESSQTAIEAKVKIIITNKSNTQKYKLVLSKSNSRSFTIESWSIDPLSISQLR